MSENGLQEVQNDSKTLEGQKIEEAKQYKEDQKKIMAAMKIGATDRSGYKIKKIFSLSDEFVVYEIETDILSDSIKVYIHTIVETDNRIETHYNKIRPRFAELKGLLYKADDVSAIKSRIGQILPQALAGNPDEANNEFEKLKKEIEKRYKELFSFRMSFILTALIITLIAVITASVCYYFHYFDTHETLKNLIYASAGGSLGGLISISIKLRSTSFESEVGKSWYYFYGIQRIAISMIFGIVVYFAIKTNSVFGFVNQPNKPIFGFILFSIVAGFSETLIPNLLVKLEQGDEKEKKI